MIYSMTGYASVTSEQEQGSLNLELRAVNHRYLEIQFRMDEMFRALEPAMREMISSQVTRGKVECRLTLTHSAVRPESLALNTELLDQLMELNRQVQDRALSVDPLRVGEILRWPGMLGETTPSLEALKPAVLALLQQGLEEFKATRAREGEKLKKMIAERIAAMQALVDQVAPHMPRLVSAYQEKLAARMREVLGGTDEDRIRQEIALFAQKIDVDEEMSRLRTHMQEVLRILNQGGVVGKRLDFLMQELNREANTLGSKSIATETSQISMELKVLIEQMREQIQNIE